MKSDVLCACGCGQFTTIAAFSNSSRGVRKGDPNKWLRGHWHQGRKGPLALQFGGERVISQGYVLVYVGEEHPRSKSGRVHEHVLVIERALGHYLRGSAPVHHFDGDGTNNANTNLVACDSTSYHLLLHARQRALDACGDPNALPCQYCGGYDRQDEMRKRWKKGGNRNNPIGEHVDCARAHDRARRPNRKAKLARHTATFGET